jgi:hypothetical protein
MPSASIQAVMYAMAKSIHPTLVMEIPSLNRVKTLCSTVLLIAQTITAYTNVKAKVRNNYIWMRNDISKYLWAMKSWFVMHDDAPKTVCLNCSIFSEDSTF